MIAALFVLPNGPYVNRPDVDAWPEGRDARLYSGPWPVVAHPPCARWGRFATNYGKRLGDDGGCFESALESVRTYGGVLEHPDGSAAWDKFGLPKPHHGEGWVPAGKWSWTASVDQRLYGHLTRKRSWLYYSGAPPRDLDWSDGTQTPVQGQKYYFIARNARIRRLKAAGVDVEQLDAFEREATPPRFAEVLIELARCA